MFPVWFSHCFSKPGKWLDGITCLPESHSGGHACKIRLRNMELEVLQTTSRLSVIDKQLEISFTLFFLHLIPILENWLIVKTITLREVLKFACRPIQWH